MTAYWWSAAAITLSCFAIVTAAASAITGLTGPAMARRAERYPAASRAAWLFRLRLFPATCGAVFALAIALPIFLSFEPVDSGERFARTLIVTAIVGGALLTRGAWRAAAAWRATAVLLRDWESRSRRLPAFDAPVPVFAIEESFPTVAVVGVFRPALFIAERVLRECPADEVRAMVLHECAHITQRDNLKRFVIRACPDTVRRGGALERAWRSAAEAAADARAAASTPGFALTLAHALIRVARLAPGVSTLEVASAFYLGGSIESRVRQLVAPADSLPQPSLPMGRVMACAAVGVFGGLVILAAPSIHQVMEAAVRYLP
jgi:hypothetical protein